MSEEQIKLKAVCQFAQRKDYSTLLRRIDSHGAHADDPSYVYCDFCGTPTEALTADSVFKTRSVCSQCSGLQEKGWLEDAIAHHEGL